SSRRFPDSLAQSSTSVVTTWRRSRWPTEAAVGSHGPSWLLTKAGNDLTVIGGFKTWMTRRRTPPQGSERRRQQRDDRPGPEVHPPGGGKGRSASADRDVREGHP